MLRRGGEIGWRGLGLVLALGLVASALPAASRGLAQHAQVVDAPANAAPYCHKVRAERDWLRGGDRGRLQPVRLYGAGDPDGDPISIWVGGVEQDEAVRDRYDRTGPDARLAGNGALLRGERNRRGDGRVYLLHFTGSDPHGGTCTGTVRVFVQRWRGYPALDSKQRYNSLAAG